MVGTHHHALVFPMLNQAERRILGPKHGNKTKFKHMITVKDLVTPVHALGEGYAHISTLIQDTCSTVDKDWS